MGPLNALREFFSRSEPFVAPMNDPFVQLDRATISQRLELDTRGAANGQANRPQADVDALDAVEGEVVVLINEHYSRAQIEAANSVRTYDSRLSDLGLLSNLSSIGAEASRAVSDFKAEVVMRLNRLSNRRDAIVSSYGELDAFRTEHRLTRPAHEASPAVATVGTIAVSWVFETILNTLLLRFNDSLGYLGGLVAAATVGAINVGVAAFVGNQLWRRTAHRELVPRLIASGGIALWVIFLLWWNLTAAHYRDAKSAGVPNPEEQALLMLAHMPASIFSWGLIVAGLIFAIMAAIAGYNMDDPYPGYGAVTRRHNQRCRDYADEIDDAIDELRSIRDDAITQATDVRAQLARQFAERGQVLVAREAFCRRFEEHGTQLEQLANALLQDYRGANIAARAEPAPSHFKTKWSLAKSALPGPMFVPVSHEAIQAAETQLEQAVAEITTAFDTAIEKFEPLDRLKRSLEHG